MKRVLLANWEPDKFGLANQGQSDAKNVYHTGSGYIPVKALSQISATGLDAKALGAFSAQDSSNTTHNFAGDESKLYALTGVDFGDVSKVGGYSVSSNERWSATQFGHRVIFTNISDAPQYFDMDSSSLFADLGGSPPQARYVGTVRDFVVLLNTTTSPQQLAWSAFNNSDGWTAGTSQSDTQTLQGGGNINGFIGGEVGYIFQERAITRMTYVGPPLIFQFDLLEDARGLVAPGSLTRVGASMFFYSQDGFYVKNGDAPSTSIGNQKVDEWFAEHCQANTYQQITSAIDPAAKTVAWSFVSTDAATSVNPDTILFYNWQSQQWSYAKVDHEMLLPTLSVGVTLEELGALYPNLETVPLSLDDRSWAGGTAALGAFDLTHNLGQFAGTNLAASVTTGDIEPSPGRRSFINNVRPLTDTEDATVICESRERFSDTVVDTNMSTMQSNGDCPLTSSGRFHRMKIDIPAGTDWTYVNGIDVDAVDDGDQ